MRIVKANKAVKASSNLEPRQRTAADGKTWWVVFDNATKKYLDNITIFGKYTTKKDCQSAIDGAVEKYGDSLQRTLDNHRKYFSDVKSSTVCGASEEVLAKLFKEAKEIVEYFQSHNKNLRRRQEELLMDLSDAVDNGSTMGVRDAIENLKYNTKGMTKDQEYYVMDLYNKFCLADGEYRDLGRPTDYYEEPIMESKKLSANDQAMQHIKAAIDILGKSGNKDAVTKDTIANLGVVLFDMKSQK